MGFLEKQLRTVGFLISVLALVVLISTLVINHKTLNLTGVFIVIIVAIVISVCAFWQVKLYKVPGYKYEMVTLPSVILASLVVFFK